MRLKSKSPHPRVTSGPHAIDVEQIEPANSRLRLVAPLQSQHAQYPCFMSLHELGTYCFETRRSKAEALTDFTSVSERVCSPTILREILTWDETARSHHHIKARPSPIGCRGRPAESRILRPLLGLIFKWKQSLNRRKRESLTWWS